MLSVRTWGRLFAKKSSPQLSPEELERRFWKSENERTHAYERTRRQQQLEFAIATTQWIKGENSRNEMFQATAEQVLVTFARKQADRDAEFQELLVKHDKIYHTHEDVRNAAFDDANSKRLKLFQAAQEQREKVIEKFLSFQEQLCEQRQTSRHTECQELIKLLREEFEKMMQAEEVAYRNAQDMWQKKLVLAARRQADEPEVRTRSPEPIHSVSPTRSRSPIILRPRTASLSSTIIHPPTVVHSRHSRSRSHRTYTEPRPPSRSPGSLMFEEELAALSRPRPHSPTAHYVHMPRPPSPTLDFTPIAIPTAPTPLVSHYAEKPNLIQLLEVAFYDREEQRETTFVEDQSRRDVLFNQVREYIENGGTRRQSRITQLGNHLERVFLSSQAHYDQTLAARTKMQDESEAHRDRTFEDAKAHMQVAFEEALSLVEEQSAALEVVQSQRVQGCYKEVDGLLDGMVDIVQQTRAFFRGRFTDMIERYRERPARLVIQPQPVIIMPSTSEHAPVIMPIGSLPSIALSSSTRRSSISYDSSDRMPMPPRRRPSSTHHIHIDTDPFSPKVLLQGNFFSKELPIPPPHISPAAQPARIAQARQLYSLKHPQMFRQHSHTFSRAEDKRNTAFTTQMHKLHLETAVLDLRAQLVFIEQQRLFEQETEIAWLNQARGFQSNQKTRDDSFGSEESNRQDRFRAQQTARTTTFDAAQRSRQLSFETRHKLVQMKIMEAEAERAREFLAWRERVKYQMRNKIYAWQKEFAEDEMEREKKLELNDSS